MWHVGIRVRTFLLFEIISYNENPPFIPVSPQVVSPGNVSQAWRDMPETTIIYGKGKCFRQSVFARRFEYVFTKQNFLHNKCVNLHVNFLFLFHTMHCTNFGFRGHRTILDRSTRCLPIFHYFTEQRSQYVWKRTAGISLTSPRSFKIIPVGYMHLANLSSMVFSAQQRRQSPKIVYFINRAVICL